MDYLTSYAGGKKKPKLAKPIVAEIVKFYQQFKQEPNYYDTLLNMKNLTSYLQVIGEERVLCATTIAEKLRRFQIAIDYINFKENSTESDESFYTRCQKLKASLAKWGKGLKKEKKAQQHANHERSIEQVCNKNHDIMILLYIPFTLV